MGLDPAAEALVLVKGDAEARQFQAFWLVAGGGEENSVRTASGGSSRGPTHPSGGSDACQHVGRGRRSVAPSRGIADPVDPETLADPDIALPTPDSTDAD